MERGTERERRAVRERWDAMERRHASATRLLRGLSLAGVGTVLLLFAVSRDVCFISAGGGVTECTPMTNPPIAVLLGVFGVAALGYGLWTCRSALRE